MCFELNIIIAILLTALVLCNFIYARHRYNDSRINIANTLLIVQVLFQISFPAFYGLLEGYPWELYYDVAPEHLVIVYAVELIAVSCWLVGFYGLRKIYRNVSRRQLFPVMSPKSTNILLCLFVFMTFAVLMAELGHGLGSYGRLEAYDAQHIPEENIILWPWGLSIPGTIWIPIKHIFYLPGIIAGGILATRPISKTSGMLLRLLGWAVVILLVIYGIVVGLRQFILGAVIIVLIAGISQGNRRGLKSIAVAGGVLLVLIAPLMGSGYRDVLMRSDATGLGPIQRIALLYQMRSTQEEKNPITDIWHAAGFRLCDALLSTGLVKATLRGEPAGLKPLASSLCAPIPRALWPNKPAPGSSDGTSEGLATFVVWKELTGQSWGLCGPFTTSSHSFWELHIIGVILFGILSGLFARTAMEATRQAGVIGLIIWILSMKPFAFVVHLWVPEIIRLIIQVIFPVIIIVWFWYLLWRIIILFKTRVRPG